MRSRSKLAVYVMIVALIFSQLVIFPHMAKAAGGPDLVVTGITWTPANPVTGNEISFSATIKNQGADPSPAGVVHGVLFAIDGTSVSWSDNYTSSIPAGASVTVTATGGPSAKASWTATSGRHTVSAYVDDVNRIAESNESNNTWSQSISLSGSGTPDLVVTDITWTPASPQTGNEVTFSAVIKNQGTAATSAGTIHGVLFTVDGTSVNWSDNYTSSLAAGASVTVTATGGPNAKSSWTAASGTHTVRAFIDDVNRIAESNESNNTFDKSITMGAGAGTADLVVTDIAWSPASPQTGNEVTFSAIIKNQGTAATPAGTIHGVVFSINGTSVNWSDNYTSSIPAGSSVTVTATGGPNTKATWTAVAGTQTVRAFVDDINRITESNDNNNTLDESILVSVPSKPDLVVTDVTWSPAAPAAGNAVTFSAVVKNQGTAATAAGTASNVSFYVNGTKVSSVINYTTSIAAGASVTLTQNSGSWTAVNGIHTVNAVVDETSLISELDENNNSYSKSLTIGVVQNYGATVPYDSYEAEDLTIVGGSVTGPSTTWTTAESEASGRKAVRLAQGQSVELTLSNPAQGIVVRYSMPDSATGADISQNISLYAGTVHAADISLTNRYAHQYGQYGSDGAEMQWSNTPGINHHRYFDESRVLLGQQYAAGTKIKLQWDANDSNPSGNSYVLIDFIETEAVPAAIAKPSDYVSITNYGATANDGVDDTVAMTSAIAAVNGTSIKGVWIPEGTFDFKTGTRGTTKIKLPSGVSVKGAGMWRSTLQGAYAGILLQGGNVTLSDFMIKAEETYRSNATGIAGIEGNALNSTIMNIWMEHTKVGLWLNEGTANALVSKLRVRDTWADGININGGTLNTIVEQSNFRNNGDDGMAMWSKSLNGGTGTVEGSTFRYNTVQIPNLANGIGIYGGENNTVSNNLILDTVDNGSGIQFGTNHSPTAFTGTLTITNNKLVRSGSYHHDYGYQIGAIWGYWVNNNGLAQGLTVNVSSNVIDSSTYSGVFIEEPSGGAVVNYTANTINNSGTYGVYIRGSANGSAAFNTNTVNVAPSGKFKNDSPSFTATGSGNNW
ncbi:CARDB domain-containing protein [Paenibacillus lignilyticus]|uniref:Right-handed parallel beta-helix repeat-containing protein n=1 Tax=Paenibacillus lignilyticus TaxID=1172615 RepID=A0ABS5CFT6_9BACL|nr:CARDB domain-containing protein [Paenibacillus lignilyticus]MBP3964727.1 right-handed parallel beta-helix repeat-containing protein [Paenibacillus lignilyticus]